MKKHIVLAAAVAISVISGGAASAANETLSTSPSLHEESSTLTASRYVGTSLPYPESVDVQPVPDSLKTVFVNHVGRHGARFLSKSDYTGKVLEYLNRQDDLTPTGEALRCLCLRLDSITGGRWGALDALGMAEADSIGARFQRRYPGLLERNDSLKAYASEVPRCVMTMDCMTHSILWGNPKTELTAGSGPRYSRLLRFFESDPAYLSFLKDGVWKRVLDTFIAATAPEKAADRLISAGPSVLDKEGKQKLAILIYKVVAGSYSIIPEPDFRPYFTEDEFRRLWECENLRQYLTYSFSSLSAAPMQQARALLQDLTATLCVAATEGYHGPAAILRFGHAETLMPLLCLMEIPGSRYVTGDWKKVAEHWKNYELVPMAANLQLALCRSKKTGTLYLLTYQNERLTDMERWEDALLRLREILETDLIKD